MAPNSRAKLKNRRAEVTERYLRGETQHAIGETLAVNQSTVSRDLRALQAGWIESATDDFATLQARELAKLDRLEAEYWVGYERTQDFRWLDGVGKTIGRRCRVLGIEAPKRLDISAPTPPTTIVYRVIGANGEKKDTIARPLRLVEHEDD